MVSPYLTCVCGHQLNEMYICSGKLNFVFQLSIRPELLRDDGTLLVKVEFQLFEDVFARPCEVWDTRLTVDGHVVHVNWRVR